MVGWAEVLVVVVLAGLLALLPNLQIDEGRLSKLLERAIRRRAQVEPPPRFVGEIVRRLNDVANLRYQPNIQVIRSSEINALSLSAGLIFVTSGFLSAITEGRLEEEHLAAILAHEIGHSELGHSASKLKRAFRASTFKALAKLVFKRKKARKVLDAGGEIWTASHSQQAEYSADRFAAHLLQLAGYSIADLIELLVKIDPSVRDPRYASLTSTHPPGRRRIAKLRKLQFTLTSDSDRQIVRSEPAALSEDES